MGTSNTNPGAGGGTPLVPSWLGGGGAGAPDGAPGDGPSSPPAAPPLPSLPAAGDPARFTRPRSDFTRFINSGGQDRRSLGRALSGYVSGSVGGSSTAAERMAPSRQSTARLADFLGNAAASGVPEALRSIGLERLAGRPMGEVLRGMTDFICPAGGSIDESIAREAFIETLAKLAESGITDLETLTPEQMQTVLEMNIVLAIEARICNDIGLNAVALPSSPEEALAIQEQLFEYVDGSVADVFSAAPLGQGLTSAQVQVEIDRIYTQAFGVLQGLAEREAEKNE